MNYEMLTYDWCVRRRRHKDGHHRLCLVIDRVGIELTRPGIVVYIDARRLAYCQIV